MIVLKKLVLVLASSCIGIFAGTAVATPFIALAYYLATDGPIFPPPLVAFGLLALPVGFLLFLVQGLLVVYELIAKRTVGRGLLPLTVAAGFASGVAWYLALDPRDPGPISSLPLVAFGLVQALTVFGCHAIAARLRFATPPPSTVHPPTHV